MEKLLLIAIPDTDGVEQVARRLRLRTVCPQSGAACRLSCGGGRENTGVAPAGNGAAGDVRAEKFPHGQATGCSPERRHRHSPQGSADPYQPELERLPAGTGTGTGTAGDGGEVIVARGSIKIGAAGEDVTEEPLHRLTAVPLP